MTEPGSLDQADLRVRGALGALEVPDHDERFWTALGTRLIAERDSPAAPTFDPLERLEQADRRPDPPGEAGPANRRERKRERTAPAAPEGPAGPTVSQLAEHAEWVKQQRPNWRRRVVVATCTLATVLVLGVAVWIGATAEDGSTPPSAGRVAALLSERLTGSPYVLGRVEAVGLGTGTGRYAFVRSSEGSFRYRRLDSRGDTAYDRVAGSAQSWRVRRNGSADASSDTGLAPGEPDPDGASHYLQDDDIGSTIQALEASPDVMARARTRGGHKVWVLDLRLAASSDAPVDAMQVIVDQRRQLPDEVSLSVKGTVVHRARFSYLRLASTVRQDTFRLAFPGQINPPALDNGFRRTKLLDAARMVGYTPVVPGWLPADYELSTVAVVRGSPPGLPATAGGDNPPNRDVLSIAYRRGVDQLTVTLRRTADAAESWKDPFVTASAAGARVQRSRLDGGRFLGTTVEQVTAPGAAPHLWGRSADFVFTVAGDLEPSQLLKVANSLR